MLVEDDNIGCGYCSLTIRDTPDLQAFWGEAYKDIHSHLR